MSQYFVNDPSLKEDLRELKCWCGTHELTFLTDSGVFSRTEIDDASLFLVRGIPELAGRVLDLGCGYGFIGIYTAVRNPGIELVQSDVNERAAELCRINCEANGVISEVLVSDGFSSVEGKFDAILLNPPIHAGKDVTYRLAEESLQHLTGSGALYIVIRKKHGAASMIAHLSELCETEIIKKEKGINLVSCTVNKHGGQ
ncbi:MAG: class I SAM-dependent methyltransferase [Oscillospiraceae bacterium]|nr:class I SAM-dependent methyltransferase [Oscillospiraceae bacterium]